jgi:hypothetical protein
MADVRVKLLKPLNGQEIGTESTYSEADAKRLEAVNAVEILGPVEAAKAEGASAKNKAEGAAPANKAAAASASRKRRGK